MIWSSSARSSRLRWVARMTAISDRVVSSVESCSCDGLFDTCVAMHAIEIVVECNVVMTLTILHIVRHICDTACNHVPQREKLQCDETEA